MYAYIKGTLVRSAPSEAIVETSGGIAYKVSIPANAFGALPQIGTPVLLYTSFVVRENMQALFGFLSESECQVFEILLDVSGIGPKIALAIIGHLSLKELRLALIEGNVTTLCRIPGIGKKGAQRMILELKDKMQAVVPLDPSELMIRMPTDPLSQKINDAMSALINLGYNQQTAQKAIKKTMDVSGELLELPALITQSLKNV